MITVLDKPCALVDLETTGCSTSADRITEVGVLTCSGGEPPQSWEQLVNPGTGIPENISLLTGITPAMVADQPYFDEIAHELWHRLQGHLFVAHNARFDYGFLKRAFAACDYRFKPQILCTLKLSRTLFPQWRRHSLDALCEQIGYPRGTSHRAMADVQAMFAFLCYAIRHCGQEAVNRAAAKQLRQPALPPHLCAEEIEAIPDGPGVYHFYGDDNRLLYIGKSKTLRTRIRSHFAADHHSGKEMALSQSVRRIEVTETVGELGALLLENQQIKALAPIYNRRQRRYRSLWVWRLIQGEEGFLRPELNDQPVVGWQVCGDVYGPYRNRSTARKAFELMIRERALCKRVLGLESGEGACFARQLNQCHGACEGRESVAAHNLRLIEAFAARRINPWPWPGPVALEERGEEGGQRCYHLVHQWAWLGTADSRERLGELLESCDDRAFDIETYRLLLRAFQSGRYTVVPTRDNTQAAVDAL